MRGKRRKDISNYVKHTYAMLSTEPLYKRSPLGTITLDPMCQRAIVQNIKRNYGKKRRGEM